MADDIDILNAPIVMDRSVRRTTPEGYPTQYLLDWEMGQRGWFQRSVVDLTTKITTVESRTEEAHARITDEITARTTADEAFAERTTIVEAGLGDANARITTETTARATADSALASNITTLTATVGSVASSVTSEATARATADSALATQINTVATNLGATNAFVSVANQARIDGDVALSTAITTLGTTVAGNTATLTTQASSINGLSVRYAVNGYVGGSYGGFTFTGVQRADGVGANYLLEITSNVVIHGSLTINGTIVTEKAAPAAFTQVVSASSGGTQADVAITTRDGARVHVIAEFYGSSGNYFALGVNPGQLVVYRDGNVIGLLNSNFEASGTGGSSGIALQSTVALSFDQPSPGAHTYTVQTTNAAFIGGVAIIVIEMAR